MADTVADITRTSGPIVWRGTLLRFEERDTCYVKLTRLGKKAASIGFNSRELIDLRDLIEELMDAEGDE